MPILKNIKTVDTRTDSFGNLLYKGSSSGPIVHQTRYALSPAPAVSDNTNVATPDLDASITPLDVPEKETIKEDITGNSAVVGKDFKYIQNIKDTEKMKKAFYERYYPAIEKVITDRGSKMRPETLMAQMVSEAGWRDFSSTKTNKLTTQSPFGIKLAGTPKGTKGANLETYEDYKDGKQNIKDDFAISNTFEDAVHLYLDWIDRQVKHNYKRAYAFDDPAKQLMILKEEGYATAGDDTPDDRSDDYDMKLIRQMNRDRKYYDEIKTNLGIDSHTYDDRWAGSTGLRGNLLYKKTS